MKSKIITSIGLVIVLVALVWLVLALQPPREFASDDNPFMKDGEVPHIIAHRGGNHEFPGNSLEAYYHAYSIDPGVIMETDVAITSDDEIILTHDLTLDRKTTLTNATVEETSYASLVENAVDFGYDNPIPYDTFNTEEEFERFTNYEGDTVTPLDVEYPQGVDPRHEEKFLVTTLEELITAFPDNYFIVEIKNSGETGARAFERVLEILETLDDDYDAMERVSLGSFNKDMYDRYVQARRNDVPGLLFSPQEYAVTRFYVMQLLGVNGLFNEPISSFQVPTADGAVNLATQRFIDNANAHNIGVHYWTINDETTMRELIELGADGMLTDRPTLLKEIIEEYE